MRPSEMAMAHALKTLAEGTFVCEVSDPDAFETLQSPEGQRAAEEWLEKIGYRLARLAEDGAFFMAHSTVTQEMRNGLREDMRGVRELLEPIVGFLEVLRQAQGRDPHIYPGDKVWQSEIHEAVRTNSLLERRLNEMREIPGSRITESALDRVNRVLERLAKEGYLRLTEPDVMGYEVTGKIHYLYQLLALIAENSPLLSDESVVDTIDPQRRLDAEEGSPVNTDSGLVAAAEERLQEPEAGTGEGGA